jgi:hypothetical protein
VYWSSENILPCCADKTLLNFYPYSNNIIIDTQYFYSLGISVSVIIGIALPDEEAQSFVAEFADLGNNIAVQWIVDGQIDFPKPSYLVASFSLHRDWIISRND